MTERRLELDLELEADPEEVWEAIATGPGISAWFVPQRVEPREGGAVEQDYGSGYEASGRVTAWEPVSGEGRGRFAYGSFDHPEDGRPDYAYEFIVEGRDGGGTVLRFVQSGFLDGTDWDGEYDSFDAGWRLFFTNLRSYLEHFAGQRVQNVVTMGYTAGSASEVWPVLHRALGLGGHPAVGTEVTLAPDGPAPIAGVVDVANEEFLGVRSAGGLHRIGAEGADGCGVSAYHYFYGEPVDAPALTADWQEWLTRLFPVPAGSPEHR
ncbi:SRPBCC family protein [Pseudonocardia xinjiangensis]|uniref:SRPBCC domain-containing protein n=1 Tax=Pseudonocardia xinjiangensis TaxID=75289 RepID=A0ABX1R752_9PSEU|nr:SRPBCC domain-containing protein [Pseudonocardia xinjiangensis]NMH76218.1 SRPBCC domain-containing protein [Pseudonocardia xinjiangensis]